MKKLIVIIAFLCNGLWLWSQVSTHSELKKLADISSLPMYLVSSESAQISSYDTTGRNDDGFSGKYSYIRRNADSSLVLLDIKGSGVINRIWTPTPTMDTLDFYIGDEDVVSFSICYMDLFSGKKYPFVAPLCGNQLGGFYSYMPIPFEKNCKIVFRGKKTQFHQIQYTLVKDKVKSFSLPLTAEESKLLNEIKSRWTKEVKNIADYYPSTYKTLKNSVNIKSNEKVTVLNLKQGGRLLGIEIFNPKIFESLHKNIDIKITWDNEKTPAVYSPIADFFGYAFGNKSMHSLLLGTDESKCYSYMPMPFDHAAKIEFINRNLSVAPIHFNYTIYYSDQKRDIKQEGKFYTHWNKNVKPENGKPHVFLSFEGKGHLIGTALQAQGLRPGMTYFFEGDDSTVIDGQLKLHGTGSEDYFNGGWYAMMDRWDRGMSLPLHGSLDYSVLFGRTGGYRFYITDKLAFNQKIHHSMEHGPEGNNFPVDYSSLVFYYADRPPGQYIKPENIKTVVYIPDTLYLYPQLMNYTNFGNLAIETSWKYGTGGESYRFTSSTDSWLRIGLDDIPDGNYKVYFDIQKEATGTEFSAWQRQSPLSDWFTSFSASEQRVQDLFISNINLRSDTKSITIRFRNHGISKSFLLHRIWMVKI